MRLLKAPVRAVSVVCLVVFALALAACGSSGESSKSTSSASGPAANAANPKLEGTVTLGAVLPLTGVNATIGKDQQRGIDLAVKQINSKNGVLGHRLVVKTEDSEGRAPASIQAARKLVNVNHVPVVVGEYSSSNTIPMGQFLQKNDVVHINPASSSIEIRKIGDLSFSTLGLDDVAGAFTANALKNRGYTSIALLAPNNAYGSGIVSSVKAKFQELGGQVKVSELYTEGQPDYRQELQRLKESGADAYAVTTYGKDGTTINKQAFELGLTDKAIFDIYMSQDIPDADKRSVEGRVGMDVNSTGPNGSAYQQAYKQAYGEDFVSAFNGYSYDAVKLAALAINKAKSTKPADIAKALTEVSKTYDGATGPIAFDQDGQRGQQPYLVATVKDGKIVPGASK